MQDKDDACTKYRYIQEFALGALLPTLETYSQKMAYETDGKN